MNICGIGTAVPRLAIAQEDAATLSAELVCSDARQDRMLRTLFRRTGVERRHSVLLESAATPWQSFYRPPRGDAYRGPSTAERMESYEQHAVDLGGVAARQALAAGNVSPDEVSHLLTVSCTGFVAPGLDAGLISTLGLDPEVTRAHLGFMGCHGLFNALAMAGPISQSDPQARILVCAVELCSLHYSYLWDSEKLVANALFADGAAALVVGGPGPPGSTPAMRVVAQGSALLPDSAEAMTWRVGNHGFEMTLSSALPTLVRDSAARWVVGWLATHGLHPNDIGTWAIHPGGPRILAAFGEALDLDAASIALSRKVLERHGNMSSATIGFILAATHEQGSAGPGVAIGLGPGLAVEAMLFDL